MSAFEELVKKIKDNQTDQTELTWALYVGRHAVEMYCLNKAAAELAALEKVAEAAKESLRQLEQLHRYYSEYAPCSTETCGFISHQKHLAAALVELEEARK